MSKLRSFSSVEKPYTSRIPSEQEREREREREHGPCHDPMFQR